MAEQRLPPTGPPSSSDADTAAPVRANLPPGPVGSRYEILEELGRGANAVVYRARDRAVDVVVAIKVLAIASSSTAGRTARVRRELKAAWKVTHPGVVRLYDLIELDDKVAISMEWVPGETLAARLRRSPRLPQAELERLAVDLAEALAAAHRGGVVHRDLKPANIILRAPGGRPVITDFGVSRLTAVSAERPHAAEPHDEPATADPRLTQSGSIVGTPMYMAPEQLAADDDVGPAADVYALGLVLYEAATGELKMAESMDALLEQRRSGRLPALAALRPDLPEPLVRTIEECLAPSPTARIADGAALLQRLQSGHRGRRRLRSWLLGAALTVALGVAASFAVRPLLRDRFPARDRRIAFIVENLGAPTDDWLTPVIERAARRELNAVEVRVRAVGLDEQPNVLVHLGYHRDGEAVHVGGDVRPTSSQRRHLLTEVQGESVAQVIERLSAQLSGMLAEGQAERGPDADERAQMKERGVRSYRAYLSEQRAIFAAFGVVNTDVARVEAAAQAAIEAEPGWADPYVMKVLVHRDSAAARAALDEARRIQPPGRGRVLLDAAASFINDGNRESIALLQPLQRAHPDDELVVWILSTALVRQHRVEEAAAVERAGHLRHPVLQFGVDLENDLRSLGRNAEVSAVQQRWLAEAPDAEQPLSAQVAFDLEAHQVKQAVLDTERLLLVHGTEARRGLLCDVLIAADQLSQAAAVANGMVTATGQERADGWLRVGQIATLQGRFAAAFDAYGRAVKEGGAFGDQGPAFSALVETEDLGLRVGAHAEVLRALDDTERYFQRTKRPEQLTFARFERRVARVADGERCPDVDAILRVDRVSPAPRIWLRAAASAGCVPCRQVVAEGRDLSERSMTSLFEFGRCALAEHAWQLASDAFTEVQRVRTQSTDSIPTTASASAILARFELGRALEALHQENAARLAYGDFLAHWGHPDRVVPEVNAAYVALKRLDAAP